MSLSLFHPAVARWFSETLGEPTAAQQRGWPAIRAGYHTLIAAPTGSGKTLAAFLTVLDDLFQEGLRAPLPDEVRVIYVSPLKALSADVHKNLAEPRRGLRRVAAEFGIDAPRITAAVRTGDTTQAERAAMLRTPPHVLVTTPESLYLLLTAERSRQMLRTARTVIVDEIHAVIGTRRGAHLALSLERLQRVVERPLVRVGLSATQKPIDEVARYLVGAHGVGSGSDALPTRLRSSSDVLPINVRPGSEPGPTGVGTLGGVRPGSDPLAEIAIVDEGHRREMDLGIELPDSPLETVLSQEVWQQYYDRLAALVGAHRTTLVFVNTRRLAERVARHLTERLGEDAVTAHHGSLSKEKRLAAENRLKAGTLKALVATASLELGIDIGSVELVCQIGSPHRIATLLQRVGRSGHTLTGTPKGRVFPISRDDLVECVALFRSVRRGDLDAIVCHDRPLDVLAQQIVAEASAETYREDDLFALVRSAWPYRDLARVDFDAVVKMTADGFATRRGRQSALVHRDEVNGTIRGRRSARMLAISSGGAIPEVADYRVVLDPEETFIGTVNEDFAIESLAGDIFQLGNASWRILQVGRGVVRVADAHGMPPTIPFWFGEAPARSDELSKAVSELRGAIQESLDASHASDDVIAWLGRDAGISRAAATEVVSYLADARRALGVLPTQDTIVLERFFDESGGMQLVLHAPFGSRINRAWGLALRKRFCRQFNFELQAAATEDALLLSLGPQHSFPLSDVFRYLHPATARDVLVQAFLDAPVFQTRWRWNTTISLAVPRSRGGRKVPPQIQRMLADDLMAAVFPDAAACLENIPGDRQIPDHPLVNQTVRDCLEEAMDFDALAALLHRIHAGTIRCVARDTPEPSPLASDILNARPYAFLDDAPLEERRTQAVYTRRATEPSSARDMGALDESAIARVRDETRVDARDADELHDALMSAGFLTHDDGASVDPGFFKELSVARRAAAIAIPFADLPLWIAAERLPEIRAVHPGARIEPAIDAPPSRLARHWTRDEAIVELLRSRLTIVGPTTAAQLAAALAIDEAACDQAMLALESEGVVLRGRFSPQAPSSTDVEWCDRRLLARIHRYTLNRLRAEIEPVTPADFMRFLFAWQHVDPSAKLVGIEGLRTVIAALDGFELPSAAWESAILPARVDAYEPSMLDTLCLTGEVAWSRLSPAVDEGPVPRLAGATPIALFLREHADAWHTLRVDSDDAIAALELRLSQDARQFLDTLRTRGASFLSGTGARPSQSIVGELAAAGLATSDGFAGLRRCLRSSPDLRSSAPDRGSAAGRWSAVAFDASAAARERAIEMQAWALLRRYGVVFRRVLARETNAAPWRDLVRAYRRLEARGEIRGGRFVSGMSGEQFALADAVERLREVRRSASGGRVLVVSAVDPLNLTGIVTAAERVRAVASSRIAWRDGVPLAAMEGDYLRPLSEFEVESRGDVATALAGRRVPAVAAGYVGRV